MSSRAKAKSVAKGTVKRSQAAPPTFPRRSTANAPLQAMLTERLAQLGTAESARKFLKLLSKAKASDPESCSVKPPIEVGELLELRKQISKTTYLLEDWQMRSREHLPLTVGDAVVWTAIFALNSASLQIFALAFMATPGAPIWPNPEA
jgi:hypothetical protein